MANTIGKDKRPSNSARLAAASRAKASGAGVSKQTAPKQTDPVDQDVAVADLEDTDEVLDIVPTDEDDLEVEDESDDSDRAVSRSRSGSVAARPVPTQGGFIGFILRALLRIPGARYVASSIQELRKVTAPTPREAWNMTLVVIAMSAVIAIILGAADLGLIQGLEWIVSLGKTATGTH